MGTNYFVRPPQCEHACKHCGQAQEIHLGKLSGGWRFNHRAYLHPGSDLDWPVTDRASWLKLLDLGPIYDENGVEHAKADLLAEIEAAQPRRSHYHWVVDHYGKDGTFGAFLADGYEFTDGEFS